MSWELAATTSVMFMSWYFLHLSEKLTREHDALKTFCFQLSFFSMIALLGLAYAIVVNEPLSSVGIRDDVGIMYSVMNYILLGWVAYWFLFIFYQLYLRLWGPNRIK